MTKKDFFYFFFLFFALQSCKSQFVEKNSVADDKKQGAVKIVSILDSVSYKTDVGSFFYKCNLPKIELKNKVKQKNLNTIISKEVQYTLPSFLELDESYSASPDPIKNTTEFLMNETIKKLSKRLYGQGYYECGHEIYYNKNGLVSIRLRGEYCVSGCYFEGGKFTVDIKTEEIVNPTFFEDSTTLISLINDRVLESILEIKDLFEENYQAYKEETRIRYLNQVNDFLKDERNYKLVQLPQDIVLVAKEKTINDGVEFIYRPIIFDSYFKRMLNPEPNLFFTFEELNPYLTEKFKKRIQLQ